MSFVGGGVGTSASSSSTLTSSSSSSDVGVDGDGGGFGLVDGVAGFSGDAVVVAGGDGVGEDS